MGFLKRLKKHKFARVALAGASLGASEIYYHKKQIRRGIKQNKGLILTAAGAAFGVPMLGSLFGGGQQEPEQALQEPEPPPQPVAQAGIDPNLLLFGGGALLLILLLSKRK